VATGLTVPTPNAALYFICVIGIDAAGNEQLVSTPTIERLTKGPVVISFVERWSSAPENVGFRDLAIEISPILSTPVSLDIEVQGTAAQGVHYSGFASGRETVVVPAFTSVHSVGVTVIGGSVGNLEKRLAVSLKGSPNSKAVQIGEKQIHQLWIEDFDIAPTALSKIIVGSTHSCGISIAGKLFCWGRDSSGALGDGGGNIDQIYPVPIDAANSYIEVAVGNYSTCAIRTDNSLYCWGNNTTGQLGLGNLTSMNIPTLTGIGYVKVAKGISSTCALKTDASIECWGSQANGRVGNNITSGNAVLPNVVNIGGPAIDVTAGYDHACALRNDGATFCWGGNALGQIGNGTTSQAPLPVEIATGGSMVQISGGQYYTCSLRTDGKAFCWGEGASGKLGTGSSSNSSVPVPSQAALTFTSIKTGGNSTCGVDQSDNRLKCWGYAYYGLLGDGVRRGSSLTPVDAALLPGTTTDFSLNSTNACAVSQGKGFCWGGNQNHQLGTGNVTKTEIVNLNPLVDFASVSLGRGGCGITISGNLWCWGANDLDSIFASGNVGDGTTIKRDAMVHVDPGTTYFSVSFGTRHTCGITTSNQLKCWGMNTSGQLGIGNTIGQNLPVTVAAGYLSVSVGTTSTCAINVSNKLFCWGNNADGQLGLGNTTNHLLPQAVMPGADFSSVSVGSNTACAITVANDLLCWGNNTNGQVGDGTLIDVTTPFFIASNIQKVSVGADVTCSINSGGALYCWGRNASAEIGQGSTSPAQFSSPMLVSGSFSGSFIDVKVGKNMKSNGPGTHVCALTTANGISCWGGSAFGQNFPSIASVVSPTLFEAGTFIAVETGELQTCAKTGTGIWRCRGAADDGQLPLGFTSQLPQLVPRVRFQ
jgi:alpha-tubulin suppressor-like RCC1 family protein